MDDRDYGNESGSEDMSDHGEQDAVSFPQLFPNSITLF